MNPIKKRIEFAMLTDPAAYGGVGWNSEHTKGFHEGAKT